MEHPFLNTGELSELTLEELQTSISDLIKKINFAYQMNNPALIGQLNMALESYSQARNNKLNNMFSKDDESDHSDKIDIS
jgi:hypothetical protein